MPLSKPISVHRLVPNKRYLIELQWNIENNVRMPSSTLLEGIYVESEFKRGRSMSFDTGLEILLSRPRIESKFIVNGQILKVSSVNKFYEILHPNEKEITIMNTIFSLPLPNDLKKEINYYIGDIKKLYYRKRIK